MKIIFQAMEDDFIDDFSASDVQIALENAENRVEHGVFYFNIHLDDVSSKVPYSYVLYKEGVGYCCSVRVCHNGQQRGTYFAKHSDDFSSSVTLTAGEHDLKIPVGMFLNKTEVKKAMDYFCKSGDLTPDLEWFDSKTPGFTIYANT